MDAVIIDAVRTPVGKLRGALSAVRPDDLGAYVIEQLLRRNPAVQPTAVDEVFFGCANQAGEDNRNVARMALLLAGLPDHVPGVTLNRLCASGLEAAVQASRAIRLGEMELCVAGGVESMTRAPWTVAKPEMAYAGGSLQSYDTSLGWRFPNPRLAKRFPLESMGETAENVAAKYRIPRQQQDEFALRSHQRALAAQEAGRYRAEIVAVTVPGKQPVVVDRDEQPRPDTTLEKLAKLKPAFREGGTVTAGNSSSLNDGAAALLLASSRKAAELGLRPLARVVACASAGVDPREMGMGPVPSTQKALKQAGLSARELDLVELNEAFAAQSLAVIQELGLDPERVNVDGGAIAIGHPLGMSGARLLGHLVHSLRARGGRHGLATLCVGVGQGVSVIVEAT
ncbi:MAG TPA: acetyl-CoA C-acyltransferase [Myxococcales bacterium]|nr:acetyl-CoA C-acyltransferase [Myxococcales bacterium]